LEFIELLLWKI